MVGAGGNVAVVNVTVRMVLVVNLLAGIVEGKKVIVMNVLITKKNEKNIC